MESKRTSFHAGMLARLFTCLGVVTLNLAFAPRLGADVIDASLKVRLNFDAAPVGDVVTDTSPGGGHPGTNNLAAWVASETGRNGVLNFDGTLPSQITLSAAPDLNSSVGAITFWMKSAAVTPDPNPYAMIFDRRGLGAMSFSRNLAAILPIKPNRPAVEGRIHRPPGPV